MDGIDGYDSEPNSRRFQNNQNAEESSRESLSFSSLHANGRLQSTPNAKLASTRTGSSAILHRVQRRSPATGSPVPVSSSHTGTEDTESILDVSLDSGLGQGERETEYEERTAKRPLPVREYWNNLLLDVEGSGSVARPAGTALRSTHAPSTGSSTLVDQESLTGRKPTTSSLQAHYAQLEDQYERPSSAPPSLHIAGEPSTTRRQSSPLQDHISRFASLRIDEVDEEPSGLASSSTRESSLTPQPSLVASRVHDIFARHIHNASTSSSRRDLSTGQANLASSRNDGRPRQRLRDLLAASAASSQAQEDSRSSSKMESPSRRTKIASPASASRTRQMTLPPAISPSRGHSSPKASTSYSSPSRHRIISPPRASNASGTRLSNASTRLQRSNSDQSVQGHTRQNSASRLSREWQDIATRSVSFLSEQEFESGLDEENDGDVEDEAYHQQHHPLHPPPSHKEEYEEREEDDFSPDLGDEYPDNVAGEEEEEQLTDVQEPEYEQGGSDHDGEGNSPEEELGEETREIGSAQVFLAERRESPRTLSLQRSQALRTPARAAQAQNLSPSRKTPPKTPHLPGFYHSTTPFHPSPAASRPNTSTMPETPLPPHHLGNTYTDQSALERSRSRLFGLNTPAPYVPGAYSSPFPHPKRGPEALGMSVLQQHKGKEPAVTLGEITEVVSEEEDQEHSRPVRFQQQKARSTSTTPVTTPQKPQQQRRSPSSRSTRDSPAHASIQASPSRKTRSEAISEAAETIVPLAKASPSLIMQTPEKRARMETAESSIQNLLFDLVKPLKRLLGGIASPSRLDKPLPPAEEQDGSQVMAVQETPLRRAYSDALTERRKRKTEQDALLLRLSEADRLDRSLSSRMEEIRFTIDSMGSSLTSQVTSVLSDSFALENRKRKRWLFLAILLELFLLWAIFTFATKRANLIYQTTYYDPFFPALYSGREASFLNYYSSSAFSSNFLDLRPSSSPILATWRSWNIIQSGQLQYVIDRIMALRLGETDFVHGTYSQLGKWISAATEASGQVYRIPT